MIAIGLVSSSSKVYVISPVFHTWQEEQSLGSLVKTPWTE